MTSATDKTQNTRLGELGAQTGYLENAVLETRRELAKFGDTLTDIRVDVAEVKAKMKKIEDVEGKAEAAKKKAETNSKAIGQIKISNAKFYGAVAASAILGGGAGTGIASAVVKALGG